jgi:hypothetical protein
MAPPIARGACPQCGAPMTFALAASAAQVCAYCRAVVVRSDRDLTVRGRVGDLLPLDAGIAVGSTGALFGERFRVGGRVQYDRAQAAGAPWQELFVALESGRWCWLANAQGRWYATALVPPAGPLPPYASAEPGAPVDLGPLGRFVVAERQLRRTLSGEGELPFPIQTATIEAYADLSGPGGQFATLDFGDGTSAPQVYAGRIVGPDQLRIDAAAPGVETAAPVATAALTCPGCGGALPLNAPASAERVVCRYCGMQSDVTRGALVALRKVAPPAVAPAIPLGARGVVRGAELTCIGFLVRGTTVDDERYTWREYLLLTAQGAFVWLLEEDGEWQLIVPVEVGDVRRVSDRACVLGGVTYTLPEDEAEANVAEVESVLGEFYWKIEVGERVRVRSFAGPRNTKLEEERTEGEVTMSLSSPIPTREVRAAFGLDHAGAPAAEGSRAAPAARGRSAGALFWLFAYVALAVVSAVGCLRAKDERVFDQRVTPRAEGPAAVTPSSASGSTSPGGSTSARTPAPAAAGQPAQREGSFVSDPFEVKADGKDLVLTIESTVDNDWLGLDVALVHDESGQVWEDSKELSYYRGVEDGESWSEGSRTASIDYARMPAGHYVVRLEATNEASKAPPVLQVRLDSDTPPVGWTAIAFGALTVLCIVDRIRAAGRRRRGES